MRIFVATSYSSQVDYDTGEVFPEYKAWLEENLTTLERFGHAVFCALREDGYKINSADPASAFKLDKTEIEKADAMLAIVTDRASEGVQTEIGIAVGLGKLVVFAHEHPLGYFNDSMVRAGQVREVALPIESDPFS